MKTPNNSRSGAAILLTMIVLSFAIALLCTAALRHARTNQEMAKRGAVMTDVANRDDGMSRKLLRSVPSSIVTSMKANTSFADASCGYLDINSLAQAIAENSTQDRLTALGNSALNAISADRASSISFTTSGYAGSAVGVPNAASSQYNLVSTSLVPWGSGPIGDAGAADVWKFPRTIFGLKAPGDTFIARRHQWIVTTSATFSADPITGATSRAAPSLRNRRMTLWEVPNQSAISSDRATALTADATTTVNGGVFGRSVTLGGGNVAGNVSSITGVAISGGTVRGAVPPTAPNASSETRAPGGSLALNQVSSSNNSGRASYVLLNPGMQYYCAASAPVTAWSDYLLPYYRTSVRLDIGNPTLAAFSVTVSAYDLSTVGGTTTGATLGTYTVPTNWGTQTMFSLQTTTADMSDQRVLLVINPVALAAYCSAQTGRAASTFNRIYVGYLPTALPTPTVVGDVSVSLSNSKDLSSFPAGFSLVTKQRFYFTASFNQLNPVPSSIISPQIMYGASASPLVVQMTGQLGVVSDQGIAGSVTPSDLKTGAGASLTNKQMNLVDVANPQSLPPIQQVNWLMVVENL